MAKLGSEVNPLILTVRDSLFAEQIAQVCHENDWYFILEVSPTKPQNIKDFERKVNPPTLQYDLPKLQRNGLCICGSGKKYKKCCIHSDFGLSNTNS
jgi:SWIM/SEC-C metal-binding protein